MIMIILLTTMLYMIDWQFKMKKLVNCQPQKAQIHTSESHKLIWLQLQLVSPTKVSNALLLGGLTTQITGRIQAT